ncbi:WecB/TagA/CpsF family glycosyltransferase [Oceanimonas pelagia]|uniref:WecB/TagA/CpsF family glycosyltransferase n=1 Tax=Oceanimonas pelagia TaxID=3028314 RepID=A0AA50Q6V9_9GAMM|nr:WecB/TagA/CpsF family glycosyltransferase [Oceanimonas pelagia]WMC09835.1 WecB/TagA/CpsF family glycosyltransferase [Oceanimonas pelagia]
MMFSHLMPRLLRSRAEETAPLPMPAEVRLFGLTINNVGLNEAMADLMRRAQGPRPSLVNFVNAHCCNLTVTDADYYRVLQHSDRLLPDGSGVRLALKLNGLGLRENLNGTDLLPHLCRAAAANGHSLYLLGGEPGIAASAARRLQREHPGLRIAGTRDGFFTAEQEPAVIRDINDSGAAILLVAMGVPRQELWLARHLPALNTRLNMGVGGLFDFYADKVSRSPLWLRRLGSEWIWRLLQEPGRMWRRYLLGNPLFVWRAWRDARRNKPQQSPSVFARLAAGWHRLGWKLGLTLPALAKRSLDASVAATALALLSPLLLVTALAIRLESPGAVLFGQTRIGLNGRPFRCWKLRSMYRDAEQRLQALQQAGTLSGEVRFKMKQDPRITRVGRVIRKLSIDELPQLWNVLRGDMSLVGPRPALPREVAAYGATERQRLLATPGITCTWQVSGRSDIPFAQQVTMDREYVFNGSLTTDLRLLLKTVPAVLSGRGAY